jgi:tripartite-type tricarboxylate transporter receptor subunit TctC
MTESGLPELTTVTYYGFLGPAGTPAEVVTRINGEINESLKSAKLRASMQRVGFEPVGGSPQDFATLIAQQLQRWAPIVKATSFQMD